MKEGIFTEELIAPCGMNCGLCSSYLAMSRGHEKRRGMAHCTGCRVRKKNCSFIKKKCGPKLQKDQIQYCHECEDFPCEGLRKLDARYQKNYDYSFIENLKLIRDKDIEAVFEKDLARYTCPDCGDILCIHNGKCYSCMEIISSKD